MGVPAALFAVAAGTNIAGGLLGASGAIQQGKAAREAGRFQAAILRRNAQFSRRQADDAIERGRTAIQRKRSETSQIIGSQRAALAAAGVLVDEGSALDLQADTAFVGRQEEQDIQLNAEREALSFRMQAFNQESDATLAEFTGQQQFRASKIRAASSIIESIGGAAKAGASFL